MLLPSTPLLLWSYGQRERLGCWHISVLLLHVVFDGNHMMAWYCMHQIVHVLVVDDSSMTRKMVCKVLRSTRQQCRCDQAADGAIAVEMMARSMMPSRGGEEEEEEEGSMPPPIPGKYMYRGSIPLLLVVVVVPIIPTY